VLLVDIVPVHLISTGVNITGNEQADCAPKSALSLLITNMTFPAYDLAPHVSKFCLNEWQDICDACQGNKLYAIYRTWTRLYIAAQLINIKSLNRLLVATNISHLCHVGMLY